MTTPRIIAHRGDMESFPENTLVSFSSAKKKGAKGIELDVHSTNDGFPVVHHDYTLARTTNGRGALSQQPWQYIQKLDAGSWFNDKFHRERVPLLEEVFSLFGRSLYYEIEVRSCEKVFLRKLLKLVYKYKLDKKVEFTSPHSYILSWLKQESNIRVGMFVTAPPAWLPPKTAQSIFINNALLGKIDVLHCPITILSQPFVDQIKKEHLLAHAANCDTTSHLKKAFTLGVDQLSTSHLSLLKSPQINTNN